MLDQINAAKLNRIQVAAGCDETSFAVTTIYNKAEKVVKENIKQSIEESPFFTPHIISGSPVKSLKSGVDVGSVEEIHIGGIFTTAGNIIEQEVDQKVVQNDIGSLTYSTLSLPANPLVQETVEIIHVKEPILNRALEIMGDELLFDGEDEDSTNFFITSDRVFKVDMPFVDRETSSIEEIVNQLDVNNGIECVFTFPLSPMVNSPSSSSGTISIYSTPNILPEVYPKRARIYTPRAIHRGHRHWYQRIWGHYWGDS